MKKVIIFSLILLCSCAQIINKRNKNILTIEDEQFLNDRKSKNNLVLLGNNYDVLEIVLPNDFNWYYSNMGKDGNYLLYEFLEKGKTFKNLNKIISVTEASFPMTISTDRLIYAIKESIKNDKTCKPNKLKFDIVEKTDNSFTYIMQCGELVPGAIEDQKGEQGELTFAKNEITKDGNTVITNFYAVRQKPFEFETPENIMNTTYYKEFENFANSLFLCQKNTKNNICKGLMNTYKKDYDLVEYTVPTGYILDKELAKQFKKDEFLIKNGDNIETTKNPVVTIKYIDKNGMDFKNIVKQEVSNISYLFTDAKYEKIYINNLELFMTQVYGAYINIPQKSKDSTSSFLFLALDLKGKIAIINIYPNSKNGAKTDFVNDFIKSLKIKQIDIVE